MLVPRYSLYNEILRTRNIMLIIMLRDSSPHAYTCTPIREPERQPPMLFSLIDDVVQQAGTLLVTLACFTQSIDFNGKASSKI